MRSILVATNLLDAGWLLPLASSLAVESGASVTLLHILSTIHGFTLDMGCEPYYDPRGAIAAATGEIESIAARFLATEVRREVVVSDGSPSDGILSAAREIHADLLILGTACHRGVGRWLAGSVTDTVLRSASIPVVTVGPHARRSAAAERPVQSILFAASLNASSAKAAGIALQWTERMHGHLSLLHVLPNDGSVGAKRQGSEESLRAEEKLRALVPVAAFEQGLVDAQLRYGRASCEILAASGEADLIILGAAHSPLLGRLAPEGTLHRVLTEAHCPVVSFHHDRSSR
jgi:nucleotide-binding universal stress UspA family protein